MSLPWQRGGIHKLTASHSTLSIPSDHVIVTGAAATRFEQLAGNGQLKNIEAVTVDQKDEEVVFQSVQDGYVRLDDWKDIDPNRMLEQVKEATDKANAERRQEGFPELHVVGWVQQPTLDRANNRVYWAIAAKEGNHVTVNSRALLLGRRGFELLTWVGSGDDYKAIGGDLDLMLRSFNFDPGSRYGDFTSGDKVAAYTIAGLVATLAGAKLVKVAAAGGLILLFKKIGAIAVEGMAAIVAKLRGVIRRRRAAS